MLRAASHPCESETVDTWAALSLLSFMHQNLKCKEEDTEKGVSITMACFSVKPEKTSWLLINMVTTDDVHLQC